MVALVKRSKRIQSVTFEIKLFVLTFWKFLCGFNLWSTIHKYPTVQIFVKLKIYVKRIATWSERRAKTKLRYHLATIFWTKWHQTMIAHGATRDHKKFCTNKYKYKYKPKKNNKTLENYGRNVHIHGHHVEAGTLDKHQRCVCFHVFIGRGSFCCRWTFPQSRWSSLCPSKQPTLCYIRSISW